MNQSKPNTACIFITTDRFKAGSGGEYAAWNNPIKDRISRCSSWLKHEISFLENTTNIDYLAWCNTTTNAEELKNEICSYFDIKQYYEVPFDNLISDILAYINNSNFSFDKISEPHVVRSFIQAYQFVKSIDYFEEKENKKYDYMIRIKPDLLLYSPFQSNSFCLSLYHQLRAFTPFLPPNVDNMPEIGANGMLGSSQVMFTGDIKLPLYIDDRIYIINRKAFISVKNKLRECLIKYMIEPISPERKLGKLFELANVSAIQSNFPIEIAIYRDVHDELKSNIFETVNNNNWIKIYNKWKKFCETGNGYF